MLRLCGWVMKMDATAGMLSTSRHFVTGCDGIDDCDLLVSKDGHLPSGGDVLLVGAIWSSHECRRLLDGLQARRPFRVKARLCRARSTTKRRSSPTDGTTKLCVSLDKSQGRGLLICGTYERNTVRRAMCTGCVHDGLSWDRGSVVGQCCLARRCGGAACARRGREVWRCVPVRVFIGWSILFQRFGERMTEVLIALAPPWMNNQVTDRNSICPQRRGSMWARCGS